MDALLDKIATQPTRTRPRGADGKSSVLSAHTLAGHPVFARRPRAWNRRRSIIIWLALLLAALLPTFQACGQRTVTIDDFSGLEFSIESASQLVGAQHTTDRVGGAGPVRFTGTVGHCAMRAAGGEIAIEARGTGGAGIVLDLESPFDAVEFDYVEIKLRHTLAHNPIDTLTFYLSDGQQLERRNLQQEPLGVNQVRIPAYEMKSRDVWLHPPIATVQVGVSFAFGPNAAGQTVFVESISFGEVRGKSAFSIVIERDRGPWLQVAADRAFDDQNVYRLEASWDLTHWFEKSVWTRGSGEIPTYPATLGNEPFFRMSRYNYVEQP